MPNTVDAHARKDPIGHAQLMRALGLANMAQKAHRGAQDAGSGSCPDSSTPDDPNSSGDNGDDDDKRPWRKDAYHGKKPKYVNPGHHDTSSGNFRGHGSKTSKLPADAEEVYNNAIPDPRNPTSWYGRNANGDFYRYKTSNGEAHWTGSTNSPRGLKVPTYIKKRFGGL